MPIDSSPLLSPLYNPDKPLVRISSKINSRDFPYFFVCKSVLIWSKGYQIASATMLANPPSFACWRGSNRFDFIVLCLQKRLASTSKVILMVEVHGRNLREGDSSVKSLSIQGIGWVRHCRWVVMNDSSITSAYIISLLHLRVRYHRSFSPFIPS